MVRRATTSFKDEPTAELPGGGLPEGPLGRAVTECVQERGELWVLPDIPGGWRVGAAAGRAAGGGCGCCPPPLLLLG